ncbi:MAG: hypothetical protein ACJA08_000514 [Cyclobacteriaceae bacterium]|jgi:hypothetical protein
MRRILIIFLSFLIKVSYGQVVLVQLPDQEIGLGGAFAPVVLDGFTSSEVFWEVSFLKPESQDAMPTWSVNSSDYQFEMNVTAIVESKGSNAVGDGHLLSVVDDQQVVRSVGSAIQVQDKWIYFLTVYSNQNLEELFFEFFDDAISQVFKSKQRLTFEANRIVGAPDDPYELSVGNIDFKLDDEVLSFEIIDPEFTGSERVVVKARSLIDPIDFDSDTITLTVRDDYTPVLGGIPDQITDFGEGFSSFDLDDFTTLQDSDPIGFSFEGSGLLQMTIDNENIVTVTKPTDWSGVETAIFTVTDQSVYGFSSDQLVLFRGKPQDQAPDILPIDDQTTGIGGFFDTILLEDFIAASNPNDIRWEVAFITDSAVATPDWNVNSSEFQFDMSLTAKVTALGKDLAGQGNMLAAISSTENKVVGMTEAIEVEGDWFYFLTINGDIDNDSIYFQIYDVSSQRILPTSAHVFFKANQIVGDPLDPFAIDAGYIFPLLMDNELSFTIRLAPWDGEEIIKITAVDTGTSEQLSDSDTVILRVLNLKPPVLEGIPNQIIDEGSNFISINLEEFLKNTLIQDVSVQIVGADTLNPVLNGSIVSFTSPGADYFGVETLKVKVASLANEDLADVASVSLMVNNVNDQPVITTTPDGTATIENLFLYNLLASDADKDDLTTTVDNLPTWLFFVPNAKGASLLGIPSELDAGEHSFEIIVSDGHTKVKQQIDIVVSLARIESINEQIIDEGDSFKQVDLDDHLTVFGQIDTYWGVAKGNELTVSLSIESILSVETPNGDWFGKEVIEIKLFDNADNSLLDELSVTYEVRNINDVPEFLSNPSAEINADDQFNVKTLVNDLDGDAISYSLINAPNWITLFSETDGFTLFGLPDLVSQNYAFEVIADDGTDQTNLSVQITVAYVLGIDDLDDKVILFPNPVVSNLNVVSDVPTDELRILDQSGRILMRFTAGKSVLDVSSLKRGIYFLSIEEGMTFRFFKN